jgi:poly-gamma-glutamate synthesis protein (capsule biosynthesis protein)
MRTSGDGSFTFAATGDSILTRSVMDQTGATAFETVVERLRDADATLTNLEAVATDGSSYATPPRAVRDQYQYLASFPGTVLRCPPPLLDELAAMGFDLFTTASNHSYDFGRRGMASTMRALESRGLTYAGLGRDLPSARAPSYETTPAGRVGLVNATASVAPGSEAGAPSSLLPGRPGVSPLHVNWTYRLSSERLERLREIGAAVGIDDATGTWVSRTGTDPDTTDHYDFMGMRFVATDDDVDEDADGDDDGTGAADGIDHSLYEPDREEVLAGVREAASMADWVVMALHAHQGPAGSRNVPETPAFLERFARDCIDAGADVFVGSGPHVVRGVEVYRGKPIFYSLGNFFCQFETLDRLPAESFDYYGLDDDRYPSALFDARYYDDEDEPTGNLAYPEYWQTVVPTCEFGAGGRLERLELLPCTLGRTRPRSQRGTPALATGEEAAAILDGVAERSAPYGTALDVVDGVGVVEPSSTT